MISPTFSSTAPAGWNALPLEIKEKFYSIAGKGDWTAHEAYDHLVPDTLKDNPDEVLTWMDGGTVSFEVDDYNRGRAGTTSEQVEVEIPDRDVSRIEAGGDYSPENTIMEDMSVNRARGGVDMTGSELEAAEAANATDTTLIENAFEAATESTEIIADTATTTIGDAAGSMFSDAILPVLGAVKVGSYVADQFDEPQDKWGFGMMFAGFAAAVMATAAGPWIAGGYATVSLTKLGVRMYNKHASA
jgi:hypothetical protein